MIIALCHVFLYCIARGNWCDCCAYNSCPFGGASTLPFISRGRGYKEHNWVGYNIIPIRTLSLLIYFTYIFININIYVLGVCHMVLWILLDCGSRCSEPLLRPSESMRGDTPDINPRQQPPSASQVSRYWVIWIFFVCNEFAEYSI
jgi:hypothetical protein